MKTHVRKGTGNGADTVPLCAFNNARTWHHLPAQFVKAPKDFRKAPQEDRCELCEAAYLRVRNVQRKAKGLPPVSTPFEGL